MRSPQRTKESSTWSALDARIEQVLATADGIILVFGWVADEGSDALECLLSVDGEPSVATISILRHMRTDIEGGQEGLAHDFGYVVLATVASGARFPNTLSFLADGRRCTFDLKPEKVSERRILENLFSYVGFFHAHDGREVVLRRFLTQGGRKQIGALALRGLQSAAKVQQVERFGEGRAGPSFTTVLFGSVDAAIFQPLLFAKAGIRFGEWIYVCNSPEQGEDLVRVAHMASRLHDLPVRVVILNGNAGFGGANNLAVDMAASGNIVLVNPDVHPLPIWAEQMNRAIEQERFDKALRGGLLFYDDEMLMHSGMFLDEDVFISRSNQAAEIASCRLLRVEHYDKGVPFVAQDWTGPRQVPAVTGAVMAFGRDPFEKLGGFSNEFVYGHYEDADLCLRWGEEVGPVEVDPDIRLVHLEGLGSKTRLPHFHGAAIFNRHVFEARNRHRAHANGNLPVVPSA